MAGVNLGGISQLNNHLGPWLDDIVGKTCQTYNSLPQCKEIYISYHKSSQNGHFVSKLQTSVTAGAAILKRCFREYVTLRF